MAEFMPFLHPPLRLPGDFIQRCLEIRIEYWRAILQRTDVRLQSALVHRHGSGSKYESELRQTIQDVGGPWQKLRDLTDRSAEAPRREAAVRLVQVYAGYRPNADLGWLGDAARLSGNASVFRWWVEHRADEEIPTIVAGALAELAGLYRSQVDVEELIREKVATHRLCLIEGRGRRDAYWDGELLDITWNRQGRAWTLLMAMTEDAKATGQGVDRQSDLGISLRDARRDLKKLLPPELFTHMTSNKGVHRLTLPASDLFCGRFNNREELQEILPAAAKL